MPSTVETTKKRDEGSAHQNDRVSDDQKLVIVNESYACDMSVAQFARKNGIKPQTLYQWRHLLKGAGHSSGDSSLEPLDPPREPVSMHEKNTKRNFSPITIESSVAKIILKKHLSAKHLSIILATLQEE